MKQTSLAVLLHREEHPAPEGHPENHFRIEAAAEALRADGRMVPISFEPASVESVTAVHEAAYIERIESVAVSGGGQIDADTYVASGSYNAALAVSGAAMAAVDAAFGEGPPKSFILGRPPGHHAKKNRGMGFCLINHAAVAAQYAISSFGLKRVAIFDFDVHHGNGTQDIFWDRPDVLYVSTHQYPFYPGTGAEKDRGIGGGLGYTRNFPLSAGHRDEEIVALTDTQIVPLIDEYAPEFIIVSAGFDGHALDPLGGLHWTGDAYTHFGRRLSELAERHCGGRMLSVLEGGYEGRANMESITAYIEGMQR